MLCQILCNLAGLRKVQWRSMLDHGFYHGQPLLPRPVAFEGWHPLKVMAAGTGLQNQIASGTGGEVDARWIGRLLGQER